ncbi:MAG: SDR family NAD(P)-dependent oxidoreductase, partial [Thermoanaerobaculia bacterium]|nr:SDR family NAD(P)-dependent oxidoreductase [Thermoanaerobaculia bacterium]
ADVVGARGSSAETLLRVNFLGPHRIIEHLLPSLASAANPVVIGVGSVAACRGRGQNVVYAGAKRALASYFESLRHATAASKVRVQFYVAGYLDTNLSFGHRLPLPPASVRSLAGKIVARLQRPGRVYYFPRYWRWICWMLRLLPWPLFRRIRS